jgi:hypothetical protein
MNLERRGRNGKAKRRRGRGISPQRKQLQLFALKLRISGTFVLSVIFLIRDIFLGFQMW